MLFSLAFNLSETTISGTKAGPGDQTFADGSEDRSCRVGSRLNVHLTGPPPVICADIGKNGARVSAPTFSPDGQWIIYSRGEEIGRATDLWRVTVDGGSPSRLTDGKFAEYPAVSPDGSLIAFYKFDVQDRKTKVVIISFDGGAPLKTLDFTFDPMPWLRWAPDGRSLIYNVTNQGATNLWRLPLDGGPPRQITDFGSEKIWYFDCARDGKQFVLARGRLTSDVVLISSSE